MLLADVKERHKPVLDLPQFLGILLIGIFMLDKLARGVHIVARIDTHLLGIERGNISHTRVEMHVGHEGRGEAVLAQARTDVLQVLSLLDTLRGEPDKLAAGLNDTLSLRDAALGVVGARRRHRLDADRVVATHLQ